MRSLERSREIEQNESEITRTLYIQEVKRCRDLRGSIDEAIEQVSKTKRSLMDRGSVKELSRG